MQNVLITGVSGLVGGVVYRHLDAQPTRYTPYALSRRRQASARVAAEQALHVPDDRFRLADVRDMAAVREAVEGMDVVVHMAANPNAEADWDDVVASNMTGTYNILEASREAGVRRVVNASTIMVSWGYYDDEPLASVLAATTPAEPAAVPKIDLSSPLRPTCLYAVSKCATEALARHYTETTELSVINLRIGWVNAQDAPGSLRAGSFWCSQRDIAELTRRCIDAPADVRFDTFYGLSECALRWADIAHARDVLGYLPQDHAEATLDDDN
jgi:nucleoside-diphosphate-sugar epimerase